MFEAHDVLFLWTETPLHAGSGSTVGVIDLPIQRERQTSHPIVQASGVKGALRDHCKGFWADEKRTVQALFGPETDHADAHGGAVSFSEARLLLFPVRSLRGVTAWITCPLALARLKRDLSRAGLPELPGKDLPIPPAGTALVTQQCPVALPADNGAPPQVVLEEFCFTADTSHHALVAGIATWLKDHALPATGAYAFWRERMARQEGASHLVILADDDYTDFVLHATEVVQRIRIDSDTGIVANGALWTEESLPADCLLYTVLHVMPPRMPVKDLPESLKENGLPSAQRACRMLVQKLAEHSLVQLGGNETVGRGLTRLRALQPTMTGGTAK